MAVGQENLERRMGLVVKPVLRKHKRELQDLELHLIYDAET